MLKTVLSNLREIVLPVKCREIRLQADVKSVAIIKATKPDMIEMDNVTGAVSNSTVRKMLTKKRECLMQSLLREKRKVFSEKQSKMQICPICGGKIRDRKWARHSSSHSLSQTASTFAKNLLEKFREFVVSDKLSKERLPVWLRSARVQIGILNDSVIVVIEDSPSGDKFEAPTRVASDIQFLLEVPSFVPIGFHHKVTHSLKGGGGGPGIIESSYTRDKSPATVTLSAEHAAWFDVGYCGNHIPMVIINVFVQLAPHGEVIAVRLLPFALFVHRNNLDCNTFWENCGPYLQSSIRRIHDSEAGDFYQLQSKREEVFRVTKEKSVIVLGKYGDKKEETSELTKIRDYMKTKGYDANLIIDLPKMPMMSMEEKVRYWTGASRFCLMVDRSPAGQIAEYQWLKSQRTILALLRPKGAGSTRMIGDEHLADYNFIELFEFKTLPLEVLDSAINWAEEIVRKREREYGKTYPWRKK